VITPSPPANSSLYNLDHKWRCKVNGVLFLTSDRCECPPTVGEKESERERVPRMSLYFLCNQN
jgi:hypothetical protein